jgi:hypothetical protein
MVFFVSDKKPSRFCALEAIGGNSVLQSANLGQTRSLINPNSTTRQTGRTPEKSGLSRG